MCFSATASFTASALLSAGGIIALSKTKDRYQIPLAIIPLIFGIQQGLEGIVWLANPTEPAHYLGVYGFLFCAYTLWPVLVPWAIILYEHKLRRNPLLLITAVVGTLIGGYFLYELWQGGATARIVEHSICYNFKPDYWLGIGVGYVCVVILSGILARERFLKIFGIGAGLSFVAAKLITEQTYASVWCFFGALLSSIIVWHFATPQEKSPTPLSTSSKVTPKPSSPKKTKIKRKKTLPKTHSNKRLQQR
jgi:hypothetical protein